MLINHWSIIENIYILYSTNNECITSANAYLLYTSNPWAYNHTNTSKDF